MKAVVINEHGGPEVVECKDVPIPHPKHGEIQINVNFASVNPVDWKIRDGLVQGLFVHEFPIILGWDVAGVVSQCGEGVSDFNVGDEVFAFCRKDVVSDGSFADYVCVNERNVAIKPKKISMASASSLPLSGLTAWQALFDFSKVKEGDVVLLHAGAGGVGSLAIQFAKHAKATVITTASQRNHEYVKGLGADIVIDYTKESFIEVIKEKFPEGIDMAFDCVGGETSTDSLPLVKKGGSLVSVCSPIDEDLGLTRGVRTGFFVVTPNGTQLKTIASLVDSGKVKIPTIEVFPFEHAVKALEKNKQGHTQGKIVLKIN
ncbi:MAG: NADP-dependent oxidoreductase [Chlamydiota bacterium]|nr:NADP-dependent oxidoreductase [Chlamydiota bacterium]